MISSSNNYEDPQSFLPAAIYDYLAPPNTSAKPEAWQRLPAIAKRYPHYFIVKEPVPGCKDRFLSTGAESDYPVEVLAAPRHADSVVVATLVKEKLVTWAAIDWLADTASKVLGREIFPEQIRHSGLKDRWAVTAQSIVIFGVTVEEMRRLSWSYQPGKSGFFLKDIHWHDGRQRLHAGAAGCNRVYTEVIATVEKSSAEIGRESLLERVRQQVMQALGCKLRPDCFNLRGSGRDQKITICHVTASEIAAINWDAAQGVRLKDVKLFKSNTLSKGDHRNNRFELKVVVPNQERSAVSDYLAPLMQRLARRGFIFPNAIGHQRLASRQLGHMHGYTLITGDFKAPAGMREFGSASEAALYRFLHEVSGRENSGAEQMRREMEPYWLYDFEGMRRVLVQKYKQLNMSVEFKIVDRLANTDRYDGNFEEVVRSMPEEISMWVAAWTSWWWNRVLARKLVHWTNELDEAAAAQDQLQGLRCTCSDQLRQERSKLHAQCDCERDRCTVCHTRARLAGCQRCKIESKLCRFNPVQRGIPLLMDSPESRNYYQRLSYCQEAVPQLNRADQFVREEFLRPRGNTPWRKALARVDGLVCEVVTEPVDSVDQTVVNLQFNLPSGAYATVFMGMLFKLEEPNNAGNAAVKSDAELPALVDEETE